MDGESPKAGVGVCYLRKYRKNIPTQSGFKACVNLFSFTSDFFFIHFVLVYTWSVTCCNRFNRPLLNLSVPGPNIYGKPARDIIRLHQFSGILNIVISCCLK